MNARHTLSALLLFCTLPVGTAGEARITVMDDGANQLIPARIHLLIHSVIGNGQKPHRPFEFPFWHDHFVCDGRAVVNLPDGTHSCIVERGPEFTAATNMFEIRDGRSRDVTVRLRRIANLAGEGWFSGETHVHRDSKDVELLMRAEDLHVAQVITWWNKRDLWKDKAPPEPIKNFDGNRFYHVVSGEDERDGGALLYCDLARPLDITSGTQHFPSSLLYAKQARERGAKWIDVEKPFWWDFPMWVAHGVADTVGIAHNHMNRGGVLENEAWGRARDREKYPAPLGNALWTQQIYYHALKCGLRLPPSAGSASGVLPNPVGYNRAYVHVEGPFTYQKWRDGLLADRRCACNGPLLRCRVNGQLPGHVFKSDRPIELTLDARLDSRDPIKSVELVRNGIVERISLPEAVGIPIPRDRRPSFTVDRSGWFLVRAITDVTNTFRFASTAPWYVEIAGRPPAVPRESAQFFVDWCQQRIDILEKRAELSAAQRQEIVEPWRAARKFWEARLASGTP